MVFDFKQGNIKFSDQWMKVKIKSVQLNEEFFMMEESQLNQWVHKKPYGIIAQIQEMKDEEKDKIPIAV